ncbi:MAG: DNA2/NAM7 family helicase, partial [Mycoplasmataceae bacterium]|nr:DNA2/NAM7 family helicase [Mycoplasmataceae bacterium]
KSKNIFCRTTKEIKEDSKNIFNNLMNKNIDIDHLLSFKDKLDLDIWNNLHKIKNVFNQNKEKALINDDNNLKILIAKRIFYKVKNFDEKMQEKYKKFRLDARLSHLDPIIFIKRHIEIVKQLFSIIVTTPETDLQSWNREEFDYALLDESSQIFLEKGIPILYFAKIKIFAGDDQQMQPSRWFSSRVEQESPFGKVESLLDYAIAKGTYTLLLDKNYRSSFASLMLFNSQVFYKGELDVVDTKFLTKKDPIEVINVDGVWEESKNEKELNEIINQATLNLNKYNKIILLAFNSSQQLSIENLIIESYPELELAMTQKKLLIRNIENIQGDEADLLIVSVAYDKNTKLHSTYIAKSGGKNALNVATSRAREKMIVIKSIYSNEIQNPSDSEDIFVFKEWLKFLDLSEEQRKEYLYIKNDNSKKDIQKTDNNIEDELESNLIKKIESDLSKEVIGFEDKYDIKLNYSIGTIKIPFVILDKKTNFFVVGLYLDNFQYWKSYNEYVMDKDLENFFKIKKYNIERISHLNWEHKKDSIFKEIENFEKQFN